MTVVIVGARRAWRDCNHDARCFVHVSTTTTSFCVLVPVVVDIDVSLPALDLLDVHPSLVQRPFTVLHHILSVFQTHTHCSIFVDLYSKRHGFASTHLNSFSVQPQPQQRPSTPSNRVPEPRTIIAELRNLVIAHSLYQVVLVAFLTALVPHAQVRPQNTVADDGKCHHGQRDGVASDVARTFFGRIQLVSLAPRAFFVAAGGAAQGTDYLRTMT
jgi:hypothetical protein